ncbi:MAG: dCTP deaminase [Candidatus Bathyarchaeota archaeon]|nr:dCTP deaminase [Candidatus Bathyarchaeota archaeon]
MMMLSDAEILEAIRKGKIIIDPFREENVGPCSVDLTLSSKFTLFEEGQVIDSRLGETVKTQTIDAKGGEIELKPGQFILAKTVEKIAVSKDIAATLEGRSSIARLGVFVHAAGLVNPGSGLTKPVPMVLEVFSQNSSPVKLYPGMKIVQIIFHKLSTPARQGYDERKASRFVGQE